MIKSFILTQNGCFSFYLAKYLIVNNQLMIRKYKRKIIKKYATTNKYKSKIKQKSTFTYSGPYDYKLTKLFKKQKLKFDKEHKQ